MNTRQKFRGLIWRRKRGDLKTHEAAQAATSDPAGLLPNAVANSNQSGAPGTPTSIPVTTAAYSGVANEQAANVASINNPSSSDQLTPLQEADSPTVSIPVTGGVAVDASTDPGSEVEGALAADDSSDDSNPYGGVVANDGSGDNGSGDNGSGDDSSGGDGSGDDNSGESDGSGEEAAGSDDNTDSTAETPEPEAAAVTDPPANPEPAPAPTAATEPLPTETTVAAVTPPEDSGAPAPPDSPEDDISEDESGFLVEEDEPTIDDGGDEVGTGAVTEDDPTQSTDSGVGMVAADSVPAGVSFNKESGGTATQTAMPTISSYPPPADAPAMSMSIAPNAGWGGATAEVPPDPANSVVVSLNKNNDTNPVDTDGSHGRRHSRRHK
jgi:hypothetical protein